MDPVLLQILFILVLIAVNGLFAMSEIAVVSARKMRLQQRAEAGDRGAQAALDLTTTPSRFLSTIQLGITLVGILAGAVGGATLAQRIERAVSAIEPLASVGPAIGIGVVVVAISYVSLVLGELVPKHIALAHPERVASTLAPLMHRLSRLASPVVTVLSYSTDRIAWLLRVPAASEPPVTEDEIIRMVKRGSRLGVLEPVEREMVERIFRLGDRAVTAVMTPHPDVVWIDADEPREVIQRKLTESGHSRFPVVRGQRDNLLGLVHTKDLLAQCLAGEPVDLEGALRRALFVPEAMPALTVLERFKETQTEIALVIDEYGSLQGVVTANDILESIVGELVVPERPEEEPRVISREDGSFLIDGALPVDEFKALLGKGPLPGEEERRYGTVGGFVMTYLGRIPHAGDRFTWEGVRIEVVDMDQRRVDKVLVMPVGGEE